MTDEAPQGKRWEAIPIEKRRKATLWCVAALVFFTGMVWVDQVSNGRFAENWWYLWPFWLVMLPAIPYYWLRKRKLVDTPQAILAAAKDDEEKRRKQAELEQRWWFRYGMATLLVGGAWYVYEYKPQLWWVSLLLVIGALGQARELFLFVLGAGLLVAVLVGLAALPISLAIILGACVIAYGVMRSKDPDLDTKLPIIGKLVARRREAKATAAMLQHPYVATLRAAVQTFWREQPGVSNQFQHETLDRVAGQLVDEGLAIAEAANPAMENRKRLVEAVLEAASLQVLVMPPPPDEDVTGIRGHYGVSGELKARMADVVKADKTLREWFDSNRWAYETSDDVWNPVLLRYFIVLSRANVLSALRRELGDYPTDRPDWYPHFLRTQCAYYECSYREALGMPSNLASEEGWAGLEMLKFSLFSNCVMEGHQLPDEEWRERCRKVEQGED